MLTNIPWHSGNRQPYIAIEWWAIDTQGTIVKIFYTLNIAEGTLRGDKYIISDLTLVSFKPLHIGHNEVQHVRVIAYKRRFHRIQP